MKYETLRSAPGVLHILDQRKLPEMVEYFEARNYKEIEYAIADMVVRGAPAIGAVASYGVYLAALEYSSLPKEEFLARLGEANRVLEASRPTAVNLMWAIDRMEKLIANNESQEVRAIVDALLAEANAIAREDVETNKAMARHGNELVPQGATILTHCNTGALATVGWGTALGVIREAHFTGKDIHVYADETRPRLQGANLTAFELVEEGIPATLIADSVAATLIRDGKIDLILVGSDRIARNGDAANKIGTYMLSELAARFKVPFYVVAPVSTIDFGIPDGSHIKIEERSAEEITHVRGVRVAPEGINVFNPAFDVTPHANITGIITEQGVLKPPFVEGISGLKK
ncbi:MAG: Methylthioribose-1-phosphate isomerase [Syntrophomonadaceae bacterium]|nr:Methylthioribose-1-phosphate isomerase [Bacillota bacterium]MBT9146897.1 Methylthioribose-1-phosphate isomerase [Bacillota bacterium]